MAVTFDLATKVVTPEQSIWAVFPGKGRRFLEQFVADRAIFLETPGIDLRPSVLENEELLRRHVSMSLAIADYRLGKKDVPPVRRASAHPPRRSKSFYSAVGNVKNMFIRMKPGDLVLVGGKSLYEPVLVGEITSPFDPEDTLQTDRYTNEDIPYRRIKWIRVREERRFLSGRLSQLLSNQHAVITVSKPEFGREVYSLAYGDFVFGHDSRYIFPGPTYRNNAIATVPGIDVLAYLMAAVNARNENELEKFSALEIERAIRDYFEQDALHSFEIEFSSPGEYIVHARQAALALVVAVMVTATNGTLSYAEARDATVINSRSANLPADHPCNPVRLQQEFHEIMESFGVARYNAVCARNKEVSPDDHAALSAYGNELNTLTDSARVVSRPSDLGPVFESLQRLLALHKEIDRRVLSRTAVAVF